MGDRAADAVARVVGSWKFIIWQSIAVVVWITFNTLWLTGKMHFDRFPFVLLNLGFSTQAAFAAPILQMSNNRKSAIDKEHNDRILGAMHTQMEATHALVEVIRHSIEAQEDILEEIHDEITEIDDK